MLARANGGLGHQGRLDKRGRDYNFLKVGNGVGVVSCGKWLRRALSASGGGGRYGDCDRKSSEEMHSPLSASPSPRRPA